LVPLGSTIPNKTTQRERQRCAALVKYQPGGDHAVQLQVLIRILAVLRWWYAESGQPRNAMDTIERFAPALGRTGVSLELPSGPDEVDEAMDAQIQMAAHNAASLLSRKRWAKNGKPKRKRRKK